jgi:hypothetical protein
MALYGSGKSGQGKCEVDLGGYRHQCRLDGISDSGADVTCTGFLGETSRGEACVLHLPDDVRRIDCRVADIAAGKLHLRFSAG